MWQGTHVTVPVDPTDLSVIPSAEEAGVSQLQQCPLALLEGQEKTL